MLLCAIALMACEPSEAIDEASPSDSTSASAQTDPRKARPASTAPPAADSAKPTPSAICPAAAEAEPLVELRGKTAAERMALQAIRQRLVELLQHPKDYHATVQHAGNTVIVDLWFAARLQTDCETPDGGVHRTLTYDVEKGAIVGTRWW